MRFRHGEMLQLQIKASEKCYYFQSDGERMQIFPNDFHESNQIEGRVIHSIPTSDYAFDLKVNAKKSKGMEMIKAVAPKQMMAKYRKTKGVVEDMCTILVME